MECSKYPRANAASMMGRQSGQESELNSNLQGRCEIRLTESSESVQIARSRASSVEKHDA